MSPRPATTGSTRLRQGLRYSEQILGNGPAFRQQACKLGLEGAISKRIDRPYVPGDRGVWLKSKWLNREEFVVVGWSEPERSRPHIGALLLGYYTEDGTLHYAGRAGTGTASGFLLVVVLTVPTSPLFLMLSEKEANRRWHRSSATGKAPCVAPVPRWWYFCTRSERTIWGGLHACVDLDASCCRGARVYRLHYIVDGACHCGYSSGSFYRCGDVDGR